MIVALLDYLKYARAKSIAIALPEPDSKCCSGILNIKICSQTLYSKLLTSEAVFQSLLLWMK